MRGGTRTPRAPLVGYCTGGQTEYQAQAGKGFSWQRRSHTERWSGASRGFSGQSLLRVSGRPGAAPSEGRRGCGPHHSRVWRRAGACGGAGPPWGAANLGPTSTPAPGVPPGPAHPSCGEFVTIGPSGPISLVVGDISQRARVGGSDRSPPVPGSRGTRDRVADSGPPEGGAFKCAGLGPLRLRCRRRRRCCSAPASPAAAHRACAAAGTFLPAAPRRAPQSFVWARAGGEAPGGRRDPGGNPGPALYRESGGRRRPLRWTRA